MWIWSHLKSYYNLSLAFCCLLWKKNLPCLFRLRFLVILFLDIQIFFLQKHSIRNHQCQSQNIFLPCLISIYIIAPGDFLCLLFNACSSSREDSALVSFDIREFKQGRRNSNNGARKQSSDWLGEET